MDWLIEKEKAMLLKLEALTKVESQLEALTKEDGLVGGTNDQ